MERLYFLLEKDGEDLHLALWTEEPEKTPFTVFIKAVEWSKDYPGPSVITALANIDETRGELQVLAQALFSIGIAHHRAHPEDQLEFEI